MKLVVPDFTNACAISFSATAVGSAENSRPPPPYICKSTNPGATYLPAASTVLAPDGISAVGMSPITLSPFINTALPLVSASPVNTVPLVIARYDSAIDFVCSPVIQMLYGGNNPNFFKIFYLY